MKTNQYVDFVVKNASKVNQESFQDFLYDLYEQYKLEQGETDILSHKTTSHEKLMNELSLV